MWSTSFQAFFKCRSLPRFSPTYNALSVSIMVPWIIDAVHYSWWEILGDFICTIRIISRRKKLKIWVYVHIYIFAHSQSHTHNFHYILKIYTDSKYPFCRKEKPREYCIKQFTHIRDNKVYLEWFEHNFNVII